MRLVTITGISSMATRGLLAALAEAYEADRSVRVSIESVGGVDAARRVRSGEVFDFVVLAADALDALVASGQVASGSRVDVARSVVAMAVPTGTQPPDITTAAAIERAVLGASSIGYSTGPSGTALLKLFEGWGIMSAVESRLVQAPPGVPVASLVASGQVALGFQQQSELLGVDGITVVGLLPTPVQIETTFAGGACSASAHRVEVMEFLRFIASPATTDVKHRLGLAPG